MDYLKQQIPIDRLSYRIEMWLWIICAIVNAGIAVWNGFKGNYTVAAVQLSVAAVTLYCAFNAIRKLNTVDTMESLIELVGMKDETINILKKTVSLSGETRDSMAELIDKMRKHIDLLTENRDTQYYLIKMFVAAGENPNKIKRETQLTELITRTKSYIAMVEELEAQQVNEVQEQDETLIESDSNVKLDTDTITK